MYSLQHFHQTIHITAQGFFDIDYAILYQVSKLIKIDKACIYSMYFVVGRQINKEKKEKSSTYLNNF